MVFFFDTRHFEFLCMPPIKQIRQILLFQSQYHYSVCFSRGFTIKKNSVSFSKTGIGADLEYSDRSAFGNFFHIFCGCNNRYLF